MFKMKSCGFTLIEMMITIAIIGILAAIAYPNYQDQVLKSRRADAKIALGRVAQLQERWFTQKGTYADDISDFGVGEYSDEGHYRIAISVPGGAPCTTGTKFYCYDLTATPQGKQTDDTDCANFTLDHVGAQGVSGTAAAQDCW